MSTTAKTPKRIKINFPTTARVMTSQKYFSLGVKNQDAWAAVLAPSLTISSCLLLDFEGAGWFGGDHKDRPQSPHAAPSSSLSSFWSALLCCSLPLAQLWNPPPVLFLMPTVSSTKQPLRGACWKKVAISYEGAVSPPPGVCRPTAALALVVPH